MSRHTISHFPATDTRLRDLASIEVMIQRGRREPFTEIMTITPAMAEVLLSRNDGNRRACPRQIAGIAQDIERGLWRLNGETIIVSKEGWLNDGQNRLAAVVKTGTPITTAVSFGVERETRFSVDMGRQRSAGQFLRMAGVSNANNVAAIINLLRLYENGIYSSFLQTTSKKVVITKQDVFAIYNQRKAQIDEAATFVNASKFMKKMSCTPIAVAYMIIMPLNEDAGRLFFDRLADGAGLRADSPILALRNRLVSGDRLRSHERLELILRSWNAFRMNKTTPGRSYPLSGSYPKVMC